MTELRFVVVGKPAPKGSLKHVGHGRLVEQVKGSKPWREKVTVAAAQAMDSTGWVTATGPVEVSAIVLIERPKTSKQAYPVTRSSGDADKHARNLLDALVDAGILRDDSQIIRLHIEKTHAPRAGAHITIRTIEGDPR